MTNAKIVVRAPRRVDVAVVHKMILDLAQFEQLAHLCIATEVDINAALFGPTPAAEARIAWIGEQPAGFALFFHTFSTFRGRRSLWLEDLFVRPEYRRRGCAIALLRCLAALAVERGCARFDWTVLDWNQSAIAFYQMLGANVLPEWRIVRVEGPALAALAGPGPGTFS